MKFVKRIIYFLQTLIVCFVGLVMCSRIVYASDIRAHDSVSSEINTIGENEDIYESYCDQFYDAVDMEKMDEDLSIIEHRYGRQLNVSFEDVFDELIEGNVEKAISNALTGIIDSLSWEVEENRELLVKLLVLVIIAAIFHNYSSLFRISFIGEQGFYITYLMVSVVLIQSFSIMYNLAEETVMYLKEITECLIPAFCLSLVLCGGLITSNMVNSMFVGMLAVVEKILLEIILPVIRIYFLVVLVNQVNERDRFSKFAQLIKQVIEFSLKLITTGIVGLNVVKGMLVPVYENVRYNTFQKVLALVPGGSSFSSISTILVGAGVLIKNSVGITVVIILMIVALIPILKMLCFCVLYKIVIAAIQPISDKRILQGIQGASDSATQLLKSVVTAIGLSVLSVAIVIMTTNVRLYTG